MEQPSTNIEVNLDEILATAKTGDKSEVAALLYNIENIFWPDLFLVEEEQLSNERERAILDFFDTVLDRFPIFAVEIANLMAPNGQDFPNNNEIFSILSYKCIYYCVQNGHVPAALNSIEIYYDAKRAAAFVDREAPEILYKYLILVIEKYPYLYPAHRCLCGYKVGVDSYKCKTELDLEGANYALLGEIASQKALTVTYEAWQRGQKRSNCDRSIIENEADLLMDPIELSERSDLPNDVLKLAAFHENLGEYEEASWHLINAWRTMQDQEGDIFLAYIVHTEHIIAMSYRKAVAEARNTDNIENLLKKVTMLANRIFSNPLYSQILDYFRISLEAEVPKEKVGSAIFPNPISDDVVVGTVHTNDGFEKLSLLERMRVKLILA